ncbi:MAG: hypothetical protein DCC51_09440 [Anaerolineae bacterium]|nr:MAG: hypothetical protein DCC51_09440 [Anaerolineae bacterium]
MKKLLAIMWKDVNVLFRDGAAVALIIAGPLVLTIGLGLVTGSFAASDAPAISRIPVLIVDQDGGRFATALTDLLTGEDLADLLAPEMWNDEAAALERTRDGDVAATVVIPAGFSAGFLPDMTTGALPDPVALRVYGDPGSPIRAGVVRSIAEEFTNRAQTGVTTVQIALTSLATSGAASPAELPAIGRAMGEQLFNPLAYFAPAMALLFLMYAVTLGARTLLSERREGTLARMLAAPVTNGQVLGGKVAGIFLGGFIQMAVLILLSTTLFQLNWGNPLGVLLVIASAALAATGWGLLIAAVSTNSGQVSGLGMALTLIFGILGGSFVPGMQMGSLLERAGSITPNKWAMDGFMALAAGDGLPAIIVPVAALLAMAAILFIISAALFRRRQSELLVG